MSALREALGRTGPDDAMTLTAKNLTLRFGGVTAIDDISFDCGVQELLAIIGPNGAGKTSMFNCLSGVYRPEAGSLTFGPHDLLRLPPHHIAALGMARMFQNVALFENLTLVENITSGRHHLGTTNTLTDLFRTRRTRREELAHRAVVEVIIDFLEIDRYRVLPVGMLPLGIQKRVELGRALAMAPRLLLLDEPVAGMNREETEDMARFILDVREELAIPMILVEHDMGLVMDLADRVLVLNFGRRIAFGAPTAVQSDPAVIEAYLGSNSGVADG